MSVGEAVAHRVLVVEDHELVRGLLKQLIERAPDLLLCGEAATAEEALEMIPDCQPDLVLVDVSLPGMNGIELIRELHSRWPAILSLALSGHQQSLYAKAILEAGARGYIMKGKSIEIVDAIRQVFGGAVYLSEAQAGGL